MCEAMRRSIFVVLLSGLSAACGSEAAYERDSYNGGQSEDERADALADARGELDGLTYQDRREHEVPVYVQGAFSPA